MVRVYVICEGATEEMFIKNIIAPAMAVKGIFINPRRIGKTGHKGGSVNYDRARKDIELTLKNDTSAYCTTFFDYYGIDSDFPGKKSSGLLNGITNKQSEIHSEFLKAINTDIPELAYKFFPNIIMHEFEALLFSSPEDFAKGICDDKFADKLIKNIGETNPEEINDSPQTSPAKRILSIKPDYSKVIDGLNAAKEIGLTRIRLECHLFDLWIKKIESLTNDK